jgi:tetratricopeptide (TPR) repeat protein
MFQAYTLQSSILLNYHQFKDALQSAEKGLAINDHSSGIYGALVDANVELGNYDLAVRYCDRMLSLRPDLRSYSRASYLRQIYGQNAGAIQAMNMAVEAGMPGAENTEWARTTLGDIYLNSGNPDSASIEYRTALRYRPGYPYALIGMAKVTRAKKDYDAAIRYTRQAIEVLADPSFVTLMADIYEQQGNVAKAKEVRNEVVSLLEEGRAKESGKFVHNYNRELAVAYLHAARYDKALDYAKKEIAMRPDNIDANELIAWIYYMMGDNVNAKQHMEKAFVTNTQNAELMFKASMIYAKAGDAGKSTSMRQAALALNPFVSDCISVPVKYATALTSN